MPQKLNFQQLSTRHNFPDNYPVFFNYTQLPLSNTLNTLGLSFTKNLNWQLHISTLAKSVSKRSSVLWRLDPFFTLSLLLALYRGLIWPCMEYGPHVLRGLSHTPFLNRVESKAFRLTNSSPPTLCLDSISNRCNVTFLFLFYRYIHADCSSELANCMLPVASLDKTSLFFQDTSNVN